MQNSPTGDVTPSDSRLAFPRFKRAIVLFARAALLRCPHCGGAFVLASWFRVKPVCPSCGLRLERGEDDYFLGSMMFNLIVAELIYAAGLVAFILWKWPDVPWDFLQYGGVVLMVLAPVALFPFSKTIWMAFDLMLRPPTSAEFHTTRNSAPPGGPR